MDSAFILFAVGIVVPVYSKERQQMLKTLAKRLKLLESVDDELAINPSGETA
jgi:hypothetical protein